MFFVFSGQTSLEAQMKELNRLQAQLEALQSGVKKGNEHSVENANELVTQLNQIIMQIVPLGTN